MGWTHLQFYYGIPISNEFLLETFSGNMEYKKKIQEICEEEESFIESKIKFEDIFDEEDPDFEDISKELLKKFGSLNWGFSSAISNSFVRYHRATEEKHSKNFRIFCHDMKLISKYATAHLRKGIIGEYRRFRMKQFLHDKINIFFDYVVNTKEFQKELEEKLGVSSLITLHSLPHDAVAKYHGGDFNYILGYDIGKIQITKPLFHGSDIRLVKASELMKYKFREICAKNNFDLRKIGHYSVMSDCGCCT